MASCGADPLRYDLKWVDGVCYRVHPKVVVEARRKDQVSGKSRRSGETDDAFDDYDEEESCGSRRDAQGGGQEAFSESIHVPDRYLARICGSQHSRRKEWENLTHTKIEIPKKGESGDVVVSGNDENDVQLCVEKIQNLVLSLRSKDSFTHFISIPLTYPEVQRSLADFKHLVLQSSSSFAGPGIMDRMFIKERKLHLTVCCLCLFDKNEEAQAIEILQTCDELIKGSLGNEPFNIEVRGLEIMNDEPSEVNVLYAKVFEQDRSDAGRLQILCDSIVERFRQSGFLRNKLASSREKLKLHMTLINSKFSEDPTAVDDPSQSLNQRSVGSKQERKSSPFDATNILKNFGDFRFGMVQLDRVELNVVSISEPGTGYYRKLKHLRLPTTAAPQ
ncbi:activating signal cointegrator 1 complex subunit 1 [Galendromus occidentalis]|uniref:Activating signal cointegrator 1 complex subunit 1 n=1 Tax=Galendromus occidentalis TaxID=34638 RepID=A0AAJ6QWG9_9ACAR|nr:activating signal cointegrator 1 complex subunit 1 [Galendromus occidentalis]